MSPERIVKTLGYLTLALIAVYVLFGMLEISGKGLSQIVTSNKLVEGLEDRQLDRLADKLQKQLDNYDELSERLGDQDEELDQIEDLPEFKDLIEIQKEKIMRQMRKDLRDMLVDGKDKRKSIIESNQLLSAMDSVGGGDLSGVAKKTGGLF
jgi:HSP90 family molecular chaperone